MEKIETSPSWVSEAERTPACGWWWMAVVGLGVTVFAARLVLIATYGTDVPFWDQWGAEAVQLIQPYIKGGDWWSALFRAHNEHHIVSTRLLAAGLFALNGQWDPLLEMVSGSIICAVNMAVLLSLGRGLNPVSRWIWAGVLTLAGTLPYGWENTLFGFQTQVYFVMLGGIVALALATKPERTDRWAIATLAALFSGFSMAGGFLLAAPFAAIAVFSVLSQPLRLAVAARWMASAFLLILVAWLTQHPVPQHERLHVHDYESFAAVAATYIAWPLSPGWLWFIPMLSPVLVLSALRWRSGTSTPLENFTVGLCIWGIAIAGVLAWSRGGQFSIGSDAPSRYLDMLVVVPLSNMLALALLWQRLRKKRIEIAAQVLGWGWIGAVVAGLCVSGFGGHADYFLLRRSDPTAGARILTRAVSSADVAVLQSARPEDRTYFDVSVLWELLQDQTLAKVLPASLQRPLTSKWYGSNGEPPTAVFDGAGVPVSWPMYSSFVGRGPHRTETVRTEPFSVVTGGVVFDVYASPAVAGSIRLASVNGSWSREWRLDEFTPSHWSATTQMLPSCPVVLEITTGSSWGGVVVSAPRWIAPWSATVRTLLGISHGLVVFGAVIFALGMGLSSLPIEPAYVFSNEKSRD